jgi:hypothetical protein
MPATKPDYILQGHVSVPSFVFGWDVFYYGFSYVVTSPECVIGHIVHSSVTQGFAAA